MNKAPRKVLYLINSTDLIWDFFQHFQTHLASGDFPQGRDTGFVFAFDPGSMALTEHASAVGGSQNQLEAVRDFFEAVFDGNAGHGVLSGDR
ncbi:hypothetical protein IWX87_000767 [Polaromonas sp. CG_9.7]|nr:hypothetical protein [Polaromonas sp. CG_9.7]MBG6112667.1 hypothetical protein [Polaromonas sp. CG_9.2]MDH6186142.1 hypothetical protein [Polaromonas sp. CG_23.6]